MKSQNQKLSIKHWAEEDRPREKMLQRGASSLSDAELIAILIGSGNHSETAVQLAQRILHTVENNLNTLGKLTIKELIAGFKGIGEAKAITIIAALELGKRRGNTDAPQRDKISCSRDAFQLLYPLLGDLPHEELWIILTNRAGKVIDKKKISQGGTGETSADIRLILKSAIQTLASGILLFHNHPSGNIAPSTHDDLLTQRLKKAAKLMDISLLDHLIIADNRYYSYADEGRMNED
ncbi:DNA repair protein RadC [Parabacteroides sp. PF5-9]|uniref:RadC family protein n=1 Tax=Parabacteroides sp. PF5-9 TaxID=1742404 RepID=UPI002476C156|nr:DNA repair protein RadC [Parabacteroides sp. PF5-9]MDH6356173.1 DNA repair protein RadC [Parabacteroides sp. PF5-9]